MIKAPLDETNISPTAIIDELTKLLATVDDNNPVVLNINE